MLAHIRESDREEQSLQKHCKNVALLCYKMGETCGISALAFLTGILHDMGKATSDFQSYLHWAVIHPGEKKNHQNHAATGAIYCWERWSGLDKLTAQIIALCINGHHTCLQDCLTNDGSSPFLRDMLQDKEKLNFCEAMQYFEKEIANPAELDKLFENASREIAALKIKNSFDAGLLTRLLLSILVDADRWDSACFEYDTDPFEEEIAPDWKSMLTQFDAYREENFSYVTPLDKIRAEISDLCASKAKEAQRTYSLSVPTGGGKTFTSLRFALLHAEKYQMKRIFYIIPYNTILDQNAADIQQALGSSTSVLVHHSNVVSEDEDGTYRRLAERWDGTIIMSSLVQFLNALFLGKNSSARRMRQLTDAVIIFDEIQSMPKQCKVLFEKAVDFLTKYCRCTVVLCTATQPIIQLKSEATELIENVDALYQKLKRVRYIPQLKPEIGNSEAAENLCGILDSGRSVLCIVNVKKTAWDIYDKTVAALRESGWNILDFPKDVAEDDLWKRAENCGERDILCIHLSTLMCPAHRMERLKATKIWTKAKKPIFCVSTALIEAGINVSFPVVVRSLAGLPSVIQAGGRCNRNGEEECGEVYIWNLFEEKSSLKSLPDIKEGGQILSSMLDADNYADTPDKLGTPEAVKNYYKREKQYTDKKSEYPYEPWETTLVKMLSINADCKAIVNEREDKTPLELQLKQSFRTAGNVFQVISEDTVSVLVPFNEGKDIIAELGGSTGMNELSVLLRKAQPYSVNLYSNAIRRLSQEGALTYIGETGVLALREGWYEENSGVKLTPLELEEMIL